MLKWSPKALQPVRTDIGLLSIVSSLLSEKQKELLKRLGSNDGLSLSKLIEVLSKELACARSTLWYHLKKLEKIGLLRRKEGALELSEAGNALIAHLDQNDFRE